VRKFFGVAISVFIISISFGLAPSVSGSTSSCPKIAPFAYEDGSQWKYGSSSNGKFISAFENPGDPAPAVPDVIVVATDIKLGEAQWFGTVAEKSVFAPKFASVYSRVCSAVQVWSAEGASSRLPVFVKGGSLVGVRKGRVLVRATVTVDDSVNTGSDHCLLGRVASVGGRLLAVIDVSDPFFGSACKKTESGWVFETNGQQVASDGWDSELTKLLCPLPTEIAAAEKVTLDIRVLIVDRSSSCRVPKDQLAPVRTISPTTTPGRPR
jgi:hypothetical protein